MKKTRTVWTRVFYGGLPNCINENYLIALTQIA